LAYSSTLMMEATCFSETSVDFQQTTQGCLRILHNHHCENPKSNKKLLPLLATKYSFQFLCSFSLVLYSTL
jgi:hypothetical protein